MHPALRASHQRVRPPQATVATVVSTLTAQPLRCHRLNCDSPQPRFYIVTLRGQTTIYCARHFEALETLPPGAAVVFTDAVSPTG